MKAENSCYACELDPKNSPLSLEHFLPELIGGRKGLPILCNAHNSQAGHGLDIALLEAFQPFRVHLGLIPASGQKPKPYKALTVQFEGSDREFLLDSRGDLFLKTPVHEKTKLENGTIQIRLSASTPSEIGKLLAQLKKRYPKLKDSDFSPVPQKDRPNGYLKWAYPLHWTEGDLAV
jgi:hypothetical protein